MSMRPRCLALCGLSIALSLSLLASVKPAAAQAVRAGQFTGTTFGANDDSSVGPVGIGFNLNFFGTTYSNLFVNNNGNVTFGSALSTFTPFAISGATGNPIIAPFFADVDTRGAGSGLVSYGNGTVGGRNAFGVNYPNVGYFSNGVNRLNNFQLVFIDRADVGVGDFDFEFNYNQIQWETGGASGGSGGLGGSSARVGYNNGTGTSFEFAGSAVNGAFLDSGPAGTSLIQNSLNSNTLGRYTFNVRGGNVTSAAVVPEPGEWATMGLAAFGLGGLMLRARKRKA